MKKYLHFVGLHGSNCIIMHGVDHAQLIFILSYFIFSLRCDLNLFVMNISTLDATAVRFPLKNRVKLSL
jgi:hypothetical protein